MENEPMIPVAQVGGDLRPGLSLTADDPLEPVYRWLVDDLSFPVDFRTGEKPGWLDLRRLAALWHVKEQGTGPQGDGPTVDDYVFWLIEETGWGDEPEREQAG